MATRLSVDEVKKVYEKISNWGRWGKEDHRGALNFITPHKRAAAARLVNSGEIVSLSLPLSTQSGPENPQPVQHMMLHAGAPGYASLDYFAIAPHGMAFTHLDALCHVFWEGKMYNGFSEREVGRFGARRCAIDVTRDGVMSRGVLLDIPRLRGVPWLEPGDLVTATELTGAAEAQQVSVGPGDLLFVRTGHRRRRTELGPWDAAKARAGLHPAALEFIAERKVAMLGSDSNSDTAPSVAEGVELPVHVLAINALGLHLLDYLQFEDLVPLCEAAGRWSFFCVIAPLRLPRGTGSPVNPIAVV